MRTENQIKSKINELALQKKSLVSRLEVARPESMVHDSLTAQLLRLEDMISMLEWVMNDPSGSYHL
ncbi:hypothetical protein GRF59_08280 [Paenibacillus sp. HJL G12]|uniref:Uncharacterized protein n=1 Tax=Paenibacillus dendrobii TaxID=2691084 RepID=A0A7X3IHL7_9BACL|nr:hypothetical protein [Paenibacillus dendrobii]MWV43631.1 hypothetical protein [Paenibacillus dendrobii]